MSDNDPTSEPLTIDLTPKGVKENPGRLNKATEAFHDTNAKARDALRELMRVLPNMPYAIVNQGAKLTSFEEYEAAQDALQACADAQEELLRSIAGAPPQPPRASRHPVVPTPAPAPEIPEHLTAGIPGHILSRVTKGGPVVLFSDEIEDLGEKVRDAVEELCQHLGGTVETDSMGDMLYSRPG